MSLSCWLLQGRTMQILVCLSSWQCWLSLVMRDETAMPQVAEHSLHSVVWTMQLSLGLSATGSWEDTCLKTGFEEGKGWIWEAPVRSGETLTSTLKHLDFQKKWEKYRINDWLRWGPDIRAFWPPYGTMFFSDFKFCFVFVRWLCWLYICCRQILL